MTCAQSKEAHGTKTTEQKPANKISNLSLDKNGRFTEGTLIPLASNELLGCPVLQKRAALIFYVSRSHSTYRHAKRRNFSALASNNLKFNHHENLFSSLAFY